MTISNELKSILEEYSNEHYGEYIKYLDDYFLYVFGYERPNHDEGSIWLMHSFYESKHPMEDI